MDYTHPSIKNFTTKVNSDSLYTKENLLKWCSNMPKEERVFFEDKIKKNITKEELSKILSEMVTPGVKSVDIPQPTIKKDVPSVYKKGDVLMHPIFQHPYILLEKKNGYWLCGLLTSEEKCVEILEKCNSRFFSVNYFTRVIFTTVEPIGRFMYPYENSKQVKSVLIKLKELFV